MALTTLPVVTSPGGHPTEATPVITVGPDGSYVSPGGSSGGGGDASAANQLAGNTTLTAIDGKLAAALPLPVGAATAAAQATTNAALGAPADAEATGDGSIVGLLKRLRTLLAALPLPTGASTSANQTTGNASLASIAGYLAGLLGVVPQMTSGGHLAVTTSATSGAYVDFAAQACKQVTLVNNTGTTLEVQQGGSGVAIALFPGVPFTLFGITNMNTIGVRRVDLSTTQVTVQARWEA